MVQHVLLDNQTHKDLRINRQYAVNQGFDFNVARVFPVEFDQLQAEYPLFFVPDKESGHFETIALLGFDASENLYLGAEGWAARYLPLTIERQPFLIGFQEQVTDGVPVQAPVIHVDMDHPSVSFEDGEPVFLEHGGEAPLLQRVNTVLATIHQGHEDSKALSRLLVGLELIESVDLEIQFQDESRHSLKGLYTINEERLGELNAGSLEALHQNGHLRDVYMMLASMPNLRRLIDAKNARLSA